jgi:UDP-glucose 4-epimerase
MQRILVTGGAGFIGANTCNTLAAARDFEVIAIDDLSLGRRENLDHSVRFIEGNVGNEEDLDRVGAVDFVIHLAASSSSPMFATKLTDSFVNNIRGHLSVLEFSRKHAVKKVLFASTSSVYGNSPVPLMETQVVRPPNFYAVSKHCQEEISALYNQLHGMEIIGFRFMSVYGPHEEHKGEFANLVSQFIWGLEQQKRPLIYGDGSQTRDFINVRDIVAAFLLALNSSKRFGFTVFNLGTADAINLRALASLINRILGIELPPQFVENPMKRAYVLSQQADLSKIERELGFKPRIKLEDGIKELVSIRKQNPIVPVSLSF